MRKGYEFLGWTRTKEADGSEYVTSIGIDEYGDKTFFAHFEANDYEIIDRDTLLILCENKSEIDIKRYVGICVKEDLAMRIIVADRMTVDIDREGIKALADRESVVIRAGYEENSGDNDNLYQFYVQSDEPINNAKIRFRLSGEDAKNLVVSKYTPGKDKSDENAPTDAEISEGEICVDATGRYVVSRQHPTDDRKIGALGASVIVAIVLGTIAVIAAVVIIIVVVCVVRKRRKNQTQKDEE